jgi:hypothetical protein
MPSLLPLCPVTTICHALLGSSTCCHVSGVL